MLIYSTLFITVKNNMNSVKLLYAYYVVELLFCYFFVLDIAVKMRFKVPFKFFNGQYYLLLFIYTFYQQNFFNLFL